MTWGGNGAAICETCETRSLAAGLEQRTYILERDTASTLASLRELESRWLRHMDAFSCEVARLAEITARLAVERKG